MSPFTIVLRFLLKSWHKVCNPDIRQKKRIKNFLVFGLLDSFLRPSNFSPFSSPLPPPNLSFLLLLIETVPQYKAGR